MSALRDDLRHAFRSLIKHPTFAAVGTVTIALAIAGNSAMFSLVKAVLLEPLPYAEPGRLVTLDVISTRGFQISTSIPNVKDWRDRSRVFESYGASAGWNVILTGQGAAEVVNARAVYGDLFATLGATPVMGRLFGAAETEPGSAGVLVLAERYWHRRFGRDPGVLGRALTLDDRPYTIVGVLSESAGYPSPSVEAYFPMGTIPGLPWDDRGSSFGTRVVARVGPGVSLDMAREDLARVHRAIEELEGEPQARPEVRSLTEFYVAGSRRQVLILMGAVGFVLLIAVANVGNLVLARGEDRRREVAVRAALGARRGAVVRTLITESLVLALLGGVVGLALAFGAVRLMIPLLPDGLPVTLRERVGVDLGVVTFTFGLAGVAGLLFGAVPAWRMSEVDLAHELREGTRGSTGGRSRVRAALVMTEIALALVLLIGAGLMLHSLSRLRSVDKGFATEGVLLARVPAPGARYPNKASWLAFYQDLQQRAAALPGVREAALTLMVPLSGRSWERGILPEGQTSDPTQAQSVLYNIVSPNYFPALGVPLLRGRTFTEADRDGAPLVAIIDETMAEKFWPGEDPVGKRVAFEDAEGSTHDNPVPLLRTVVGVAKNVRHYELANPSRIQVYVPLTQTQRVWGASLTVLLRTDVPPRALATPLTRAVAAMDPDVPVSEMRALRELVNDDLGASRAMGTLLGIFSGLSLLLACVGIFGVMSYSVAQRTREIGIRMALGASTREVWRWVTRFGLTLTAGGIVAGLAAAAGLSRLIAGLLYEVSPLDPVLYGGVALSLLGVALAAIYLPARRAMRVDPVAVLNSEG